MNKVTNELTMSIAALRSRGAHIKADYCTLISHSPGGALQRGCPKGSGNRSHNSLERQ